MTESNLTYSATVLEDSIAENGKRLTTLVATFPRAVLAEFNTHRVFSRNSASSRAIPVAKQIRMVMENPFIPDSIGRNKAGMQSGEPITGERLSSFQNQVRVQRDRAVIGVLEHLMTPELVLNIVTPEVMSHIMVHGLEGHPGVVPVLLAAYEKGLKNDYAEQFLNVHKETTNRYLEPFMWHTVVVTATEWSNFFALRMDEHADPKIQKVAVKMFEAMEASAPTLLLEGEWHAPFLDQEEKGLLKEDPNYWTDVSVGRCARVSYLTHFGTRDPEKDRELAKRLFDAGHMSPYEHVATPLAKAIPNGNFIGWGQLRKTLPNENDFSNR